METLPNAKRVILRFLNSGLKNSQKAVELAKNLAGYEAHGEGENATHIVVFNTENYRQVLPLISIVKAWATTRFEIDGQNQPSIVMWLSCFGRFKTPRKKCSCRIGYGSFVPEDGVEFLVDVAETFGTYNRDANAWIVRQDEMMEQYAKFRTLQENNLCPSYDRIQSETLYLTALGKIPDRIDPKVNGQWGFMDEKYEKWFYDGKSWVEEFGRKRKSKLSKVNGVAYKLESLT